MTADRRDRADGRRGAPPTHGAAPAQPVVRGVVRSHVETAVGVLRDHLAEPWTLDSLANDVRLSRSQLVRAFDAVTSLGPMAYLRLMRAQQMARLLTRSAPPGVVR
jgi:transcriptional regulator GlxA family with amidase domain